MKCNSLSRLLQGSAQSIGFPAAARPAESDSQTVLSVEHNTINSLPCMFIAFPTTFTYAIYSHGCTSGILRTDIAPAVWRQEKSLQRGLSGALADARMLNADAKQQSTPLDVMSAAEDLREVKEVPRAGTRWALKIACSACLTYISLQWLASLSGQQRLQLPGWLLAKHSTVLTWTIHIIAAVLTIVWLVKLIPVAKVSLRLLLGFATRRSSDDVIADDVIADNDCRRRSLFSSGGGSISQRTTMNSSGGGAVASSSDAGGYHLSFGFEISKAAQDMLRCSAAGAVKMVNGMLPHAWMNSASGKLSGGDNLPELLESPSGGRTKRFGRPPQSLAIPISNYRSNSGIRSSMPESYSQLIRKRLSADSLLGFISTEVKQAYSAVPEHNGRFLVLHVDKDPIDQSVVRLLLESGHNSANQFKVVTARSGIEALDMISSSRFLPDIVLMDTMLADMKASEVCDSLRADYSSTELAIVLVTGRSGESDALAALGNGVNDFILKPLRQVELLARINSQLNVKQSIRREAESRSHYDLLVQILPPHVISRLAQGRYAPEQHDQVTILFSDIVGFTDLCSRWQTHQVVTMLDIMFSCFDDLCDKHGAFKVETIGDAYMVASGHEGSKDHALRLAAMAVDMLESMQGLEEQIGAPVKIRIGMHTGSALSGIVGKRRPRYCFFGDTVNTASRMESTGHPMTIQISEACRRSMLAATDAPAATDGPTTTNGPTTTDGPTSTDSDATVTVLRRPAPAVVSLTDVHKSDFFLPSSPKGSFSRTSPPHRTGSSSSTPSRTTTRVSRSRRTNSSRPSNCSDSTSQRPSLELPRTDQQQAVATFSATRVSLEKLPRRPSSFTGSSSQRPSLEMARADQQQAVATSSANRPSLEKLPHNNMIAAAVPVETMRNAMDEESGEGGSHALSSEPAPESDSSAGSSDSSSSSQLVRRRLLIQGRVALKPHSAGSADSRALEAAAGSRSHDEISEASEPKVQGVGDSWLMLAVSEERHPGLPCSILNLGIRSVKGKGSMKTHLLKVGNWQQAVLAVKAEQEAVRVDAPTVASGTTATQ